MTPSSGSVPSSGLASEPFLDDDYQLFPPAAFTYVDTQPQVDPTRRGPAPERSPVRSRFDSPDGSTVVSVVVRQASGIRPSLLQVSERRPAACLPAVTEPRMHYAHDMHAALLLCITVIARTCTNRKGPLAGGTVLMLAAGATGSNECHLGTLMTMPPTNHHPYISACHACRSTMSPALATPPKPQSCCCPAGRPCWPLTRCRWVGPHTAQAGPPIATDRPKAARNAALLQCLCAERPRLEARKAHLSSTEGREEGRRCPAACAQVCC